MLFELFDLTLFDDGGASDGGTGEGTEGVGAADQQGDTADKGKAFNDLIKGEYKDEYDKSIQKVINKRFAETKQYQTSLEEQTPLINLLKQRYGTENIADITSAIENDQDYWNSRAEELGMTNEQAMLYEKAMQENAILKQAQADRQREEHQNEQVKMWFNEAEKVKEIYPDFDLMQELQGPGGEAFAAQLKAGVPIQTAYETAHWREFVEQEKSKTEKNVINNIKARGTRPQENGSTNPITTSKDLSKLTLNDINEIKKRVARGETVTFDSL